MIRILLADDSPTAREFLTEILQIEPDIEVVGVAENGVEAVRMAEELQPNLVIMDVNMPLMNGFEATKEVMIRVPTPTLILTGEYDVSDPVFAGNSFRSGALAAFPKLPGMETNEFESAVQEFLRIVKQMAQAKVHRHWRYAPHLLTRSGAGTGIMAVGVTLSHRGALGLGRLLAQLPEDFAAPILVVPHVGHGFGDGFVAWLGRQCDLRVKVAEHGDEIEPATVYVAPENLHLTVTATATRATVQLSADPPSRGFRPSSSVLFASLADVYGDAAAALFLQGLADDAMLGLCAIRLAGGRVLAQRHDHRVLRSMGEEICNGLADAVLPIEHIASQLREVVCSPQTAEEPGAADTLETASLGDLHLSCDSTLEPEPMPAEAPASPEGLCLSEDDASEPVPAREGSIPALAVSERASVGGLRLSPD